MDEDLVGRVLSWNSVADNVCTDARNLDVKPELSVEEAFDFELNYDRG